MPMTAQNAAHACDCGKVKVTLLGKRNAAEALTAPLNGKAIAIDNVADLIYIIQTDKSGYTRSTTYKVTPVDECTPSLSTLWANL